MTLLGVLVVLLSGGLRFGVRVWERSEAHLSATDELRLVQGLLRRTIGAAYPFFLSADPAQARVDFDGEMDEVTFLAPSPAALGSAGRARISLRQTRWDGRNALVMTAEPELAWPDSGPPAEEVLLTGLRSVKFSYFGRSAADLPPSWQDRWRNKHELPELVLVSVAFEDGDPRLWPDLVIAPQISVDVGCVFDPLTKGCRGR